jgi:Fe-S-cluster containining protein
VWFEPTEAPALASALGLSVGEFYRDHTRLVRGRFSLKEKRTEHGHDCEFLDRTSAPGRALCSVHAARPVQCRTWPFWPRALASPEAWQAEAADCPGIAEGLAGRGTLHSADQIAEQAGLDAAAVANTAPR